MNMKKWKKILGSMMLVFGLCFSGAVNVSAAEVEMVLNTTASGKAGDTVYAQVVLNRNPGISTMGVRMTYDEEFLTYEGETWHSEIATNSRNMSLVSDIEEGDDKILNISTILDSGYSISGEPIVTIKFTAKQAFASMPVQLEARDVTDLEYAAVTVVGISNGIISSGSNDVPDDTQNPSDDQPKDTQDSQTPSTSEAPDSSEGNNSENNNSEGNNSENNNNSSNNNSNNNNSNNNSSNNNSSNNNQSNNSNLDDTFKTGAVDARIVLGIIAVVLVGIAFVCIKVLRKREY